MPTESKTNDMRTCVLALLAQAMPEAKFDEEDYHEDAFLKPYHKLFSDMRHRRRMKIIREVIANPEPEDQRLTRLTKSQDLSLLETVVIFLCYENECDPMVGRCIARLQQPMGGSRPTLGLLSALLSSRKKSMTDPEHQRTQMAKIANSKAEQLGLLQILNTSAPLPERAVQMPAAVALAVTADDIVWPGATVGLSGMTFELPDSIADLAQLQAEALTAMPDSVLVLRGASNQEVSIAAGTIAKFADRVPIFINDEAQALPALGPICHDRDLMPIFSYVCGPGEQIRLPEIKGYQGPVMVMAGLEGSFESFYGTVTSWKIPIPTQNERMHLWQTHLDNDELARKMACDHVHSTARIVELANLAKRQCIADNKDTTSIDEMRKAAWLSESSGLSSLAQPVLADVPDEALIVTKITREQLELLENRCRFRERLGEGLGITLKAGYQMGVKALFTGASGTGKTLASGWLANKLGLPLYRVDLSAISSKYIGETEKNLAQLLARAEQQEVVLLFDEADSVFGKRTEIKDANDRFANAQTNYLLQRIETFNGVVILTSNSKARFDSAFTRRLDMMIEFPLPNPEERRDIWLSHLGTYHQLTLGNMNQLAVQCDLAGGQIRNVVLSAAVKAKQADRPITMEDLVNALVGECRKLGKQMPPELRRIIQPN